MRVLVGGYYGFGNLGDEALLAGMVVALHRGGHRVTVLSHDPAATAREHGVAARHRLWGLLTGLLGCDVFVSGGGGLLQDRTSARSLGYYLGAIHLARRLGRRVVVFGQSIGPLSDGGKRRVGRALTGVQVSVRDAGSQALLAQLGIDAHLGADAALLLPCPDSADPGSGPVLLVPRHGYPWITEALAEAARILVEAGVPCAALALHAAQDDSEIGSLLRAVPSISRLGAADYRAALTAIGGARYLLSGRLHGLVLAAICGRGHAGLIYDPKVAGFLRDSAAPGFGPPGSKPGAAPAADPATLAALADAAAPLDPAAGGVLRGRAQAAEAWLENAIMS